MTRDAAGAHYTATSASSGVVKIAAGVVRCAGALASARPDVVGGDPEAIDLSGDKRRCVASQTKSTSPAT